MNRWPNILVMFIALAILGGCARQATKAELFPLMYEQKPRSIVILPPINESTAADAPTYYSTTVQEPLVYTGFYVLPYEISTDILHNEGITDGEQLYDMPLNMFKEYFGADAVLFTRIKKWDTAYLVIASTLTVEVECELKSSISGEKLWNYSGTVVIDLSGGSYGGDPLSLIVKVVATAVSTAVADYVPYARQANYMALSAMPYGPYHPKYEKDAGEKIFIQDSHKKK
ncbi:GNA1162 family protein [Desulfocurvibacter africanus]|uniref:GNA1162 family protein n=1 Tax=Desulfocurvibacter africanus TaxID=873 RepID=UPI0004802C8A|nr:GNA1162 family protein [Desulfocurvibacter africanus]